VSDLAKSTLLVTEFVVKADPAKAAGQQRLMESTGVQRGWGDAYGYAMAATGRAEVVLDPVMKVWDNAPLQVVMEEAGGTFTDWHGAPTIWNGSAIATNGSVFDAVMQTVRGGLSAP
jgi:fructose-1,6-bisphosphatase/inositol monophosphatase family enzyme